MTYDAHQLSAVLVVCACCGQPWWMTEPVPVCIQCRRTNECPIGEHMELKDAEGWEKANKANTDPYGHRVMTYAEDWANLMEARMAAGEQLEDIAKPTSHEADTDGITGFMYGAAVATLAAVWKHGEALRRWHNLKTQIRNEGERANASGGVLNPALLNIGKD